MKVLLVDDEPRLVHALDRVLRVGGDSGWVVSTAMSAREALAKLDHAAVDVVVSDMSMPEMDGTALLSEIRVRWPGTVRVVLSGHSDPASATRAASIAHQFFEKPVRAADLIAALREIEACLRPSPSAPLREILGAIGHLPAAPAAFVELSAAMDDPRVRVDDLIVVVKRDPALVAKVLQLASSTFFTRGLPARDLRTAIGRLGVRLVAALALAGSAFNVDRSSGVTLEQLTTHAVEAATAAHGVAAPRYAEDAFVAALLADIGLSALACWMPSRVRDARTHAARNHVGLHQAEEALYGSTHAELGAYLLGLWRLPPPVVEAVALHHAADRSTLCDLPIALAVYDAHAKPGPVD